MLVPAKILVVDDQQFVRRTLCSLLDKQPHWKVYEAEDGIAAVERARQIKPDVVVMDIVMPNMSGIAVNAGVSSSWKRKNGAPTEPREEVRHWKVVDREGPSEERTDPHRRGLPCAVRLNLQSRLGRAPGSC